MNSRREGRSRPSQARIIEGARESVERISEELFGNVRSLVRGTQTLDTRGAANDFLSAGAVKDELASV